MRIKLQDREAWHSVFLLFPRVINNNIVWLERVQRKKVFEEFGFYDAGWVWKYKLKDGHGKT